VNVEVNAHHFLAQSRASLSQSPITPEALRVRPAPKA
jgi:hypothetical protein